MALSLEARLQLPERRRQVLGVVGGPLQAAQTLELGLSVLLQPRVLL